MHLMRLFPASDAYRAVVRPHGERSAGDLAHRTVRQLRSQPPSDDRVPTAGRDALRGYFRSSASFRVRIAMNSRAFRTIRLP